MVQSSLLALPNDQGLPPPKSPANSWQGKNWKNPLALHLALETSKKKGYLPLTPLRSAVCTCWHWIYCANTETQRTATTTVLTEAHIPCLLLFCSCRGQPKSHHKLQCHNKFKSIILLLQGDCSIPPIFSSQAQPWKWTYWRLLFC